MILNPECCAGNRIAAKSCCVEFLMRWRARRVLEAKMIRENKRRLYIDGYALALQTFFVCASIQHFVRYLLVTEPLECQKFILCSTVADDNHHQWFLWVLCLCSREVQLAKRARKTFTEEEATKGRWTHRISKANAQFTPLRVRNWESGWKWLGSCSILGIHFG